MKKLISFILAAALLVSVLSVPASAAYVRNGWYEGIEWNASLSLSASACTARLSYGARQVLVICYTYLEKAPNGNVITISDADVGMYDLQTTFLAGERCSLTYCKAEYSVRADRVTSITARR